MGKNNYLKITSVILIAFILLSYIFTLNVYAENTTKGSIQITKLDQTTNAPISGVGFTIYKVEDAETSTELKSTYTPVQSELITTTSGIVTFSNLSVGRYLVVESTAPNNLTGELANFLVDIPQYNSDGSANYDVEVSPKNTIGFGELTIKSDAGTVYSVEYQKSDGTWDDITNITTNSNGTKAGITSLTIPSDTESITLSNLPIGTYRFTQVSVPYYYVRKSNPFVFTVENENGNVVTKDSDGNVITVYNDYSFCITSTSKSTENNILTIDRLNEYYPCSTYAYFGGNDNRIVYNNFKFGYDIVMSTGSMSIYGIGIDANYISSDELNISNGTHTSVLVDSSNITLSEVPGSVYISCSPLFTYEDLGTGGAYIDITFKYLQSDDANETNYYEVELGEYTYTPTCLEISKTDGQNPINTVTSFIISNSNSTDAYGNPVSGISNLYCITPTSDYSSTETTFYTGSAWYLGDCNWIRICGLEPGTYYLFETEAPTYEDEDGTTKYYQKLTQPVKIVFTGNGSVTVENYKPADLPLTGAFQTVSTIALGIVIMCIGLIYYKKHKNN